MTVWEGERQMAIGGFDKHVAVRCASQDSGRPLQSLLINIGHADVQPDRMKGERREGGTFGMSLIRHEVTNKYDITLTSCSAYDATLESTALGTCTS